ncbi:PE family protein [Rhodococcus spelaei]|uniref:PE family protein n=1 Tax=Rhodococcus spelaei TaxID=2546320 RepID=A0A541BR51_9NOCA|nr:PE family protein [Rhodococcus spelaei]TQF74785.1 PE family protein [Rhodococcus spelaei]
MPGHVYVSPDALISAAAQLEALADRLEAAVHVNGPALHMAPAGTEEVSTMAAGFFNSVADSFLPSAATGITELRTAAATLRKHAAEYQGLDHSFGASLAAGM